MLQLVHDVRMKKFHLKMLSPIPLPPTEISLENIENVMEKNALRCMCITCMKPTCGTCSAGISKITYVKCNGCSIPHV